MSLRSLSQEARPTTPFPSQNPGGPGDVSPSKAPHLTTGHQVPLTVLLDPTPGQATTASHDLRGLLTGVPRARSTEPFETRLTTRCPRTAACRLSLSGREAGLSPPRGDAVCRALPLPLTSRLLCPNGPLQPHRLHPGSQHAAPRVRPCPGCPLPPLLSALLPQGKSSVPKLGEQGGGAAAPSPPGAHWSPHRHRLPWGEVVICLLFPNSGINWGPSTRTGAFQG